jgi:hypothetical protein
MFTPARVLAASGRQKPIFLGLVVTDMSFGFKLSNSQLPAILEEHTQSKRAWPEE